MADPAALTDPAVAAGLIAAVGAIGLTVRSRLLAKRPHHTDKDRQLWFTRAALAATERSFFYEDDELDNTVIDLRPPYLRADIDLTEAQPTDQARAEEHSTVVRRDVETSVRNGPEHDTEEHRDVELDLSDDTEPTIGLDVMSNKETTEPPGRPT